ncbi:hypothetical protein ACHAWF_007032 [Thalassiosira exigua]
MSPAHLNRGVSTVREFTALATSRRALLWESIASRLAARVVMRNLRFLEKDCHCCRRATRSSHRFFDLAMPVLSLMRVVILLFFIVPLPSAGQVMGTAQRIGAAAGIELAVLWIAKVG